MNIEKLQTEKRNPNTFDIDKKNTLEILTAINNEDLIVAQKISENLGQISKIVDKIVNQVKQQGRVFYVGAGTSGRIGILDASEILPTFGDGDIFHGLIAGGDIAIKKPVENAEDDILAFKKDIEKYKLTSKDCIIGIGASGRTPYVIGALNYAKDIKCLGVGICMTDNSEFSKITDNIIFINTGPEVITGSTRMKAGTATKLLCNMISTTVMIKMGKVYQNLMIDVKATNEKLQQRCINIVKQLTEINDDEEIRTILINHNWNIKKTLSMLNK